MEVLPDLFEKDLITIKEWEILGPLGLIIQGILGVMSFSALIIKRYFEHPKRPWNIWVLDTSKQVISSALVHWMNMMLSLLLREGSVTDGCEWYFINFACDVAIGTFIWFLIIKLIEGFAALNGIDVLNTGVYVHEDYSDISKVTLEPTQQESRHKIDYKIWFIQLVVWSVVVVIVKIIMFFSIQLFSTYFEQIADFLLGWLKKFPDLKLILIMIIVPIILNSIQFWLQDNILKGKKENILKFINSPFNNRTHTKKIPAKLQLNEESKLNIPQNDKEQSISEYIA